MSSPGIFEGIPRDTTPELSYSAAGDTNIEAWFKKALFRVTLGTSVRHSERSRAGAGFGESLVAAPGLQFWENRVYPRSSSQ